MTVPGLNTTVSGFAVTGSGDKTNDTGFKLFGGYNFTPNWGVELAYIDFGNSYSMQTNIAGTPVGISGAKASGWNLAGVGTLPLSKEFSIFGKLGWAWNHSDGGTAIDGVTGTRVTVGTYSRSYGMAGVGANFIFTKNWAARLEYEDFGRVTSDDVWGTGSSGAVKATAWSLSAKYSF